MNSNSDCEQIKQSILANLKNESLLPDTNSQVFILIIAVFSCQDIDISKSKLDPSTCAAFDETGYKSISLLRTQGMPQILGVIQHLDTHAAKKQKDIKKLFSRYYESEFPDSSKLVNSEKPLAFIRALESSLGNIEEPGYKNIRSYMWAHQIDVNNNLLQLTGYLKGTGYLNANSLVHITGIGDFNISSLITSNGEFFPTEPESIIAENDPGEFAAEQTWPDENELTDAFARLEVKTDHKAIDIDESDNDEELVISDDEKVPFEFENREKDDLDFPDEVNTPHDQPARIRFQKYRGLASFRTSEWDPYENLPQAYGKLYEFKEPNHIIKKIAIDLAANTSQTNLGMLVTIKILNFPMNCIQPDLPIILSSVLPHERKLSVLNFKLER